MPRLIDEEGNETLVYNPTPDTCPNCHMGINPLKIGANLIRYEDHAVYIIEVIYRCPRHECNRAFIAAYRQENIRGRRYDGEYHLFEVLPCTVRKEEKPEEITSVSPEYVNILQQSIAAEIHGLDMIAGCGYRKALEFLIKDYIVQKELADPETIQRAFLGTCIEKYIDDAKIKKCAQRAAWLGNDEVHYMRKWGEKDIEDLKILLRLTEVWIESSILTEKYEKDMADGK